MTLSDHRPSTDRGVTPINGVTRSEWVDVAKGIGIFLVVYGHVARGLVKARLMEDSEAYRTIDSVIYTFHMPLFFFLSGLFFCESLAKRGRGRLILNKIDTIVYPYVLWSLIQGFSEVFLSRYTNGSTSMADVLVLFWLPHAQFWFLYALFLIFVVFSVIVVRRTSFIVALFLICAALFVEKDRVAFGNALDLFVGNGVFFAAGMAFEQLRLTSILRRGGVLVALAAVFAAFQYYFHAVLHHTYTDVGVVFLLLALSSILFIASLSVNLDRFKPRILLALGVASMAIYLMHILFSSGARVVSSKFLHINSTSTQLIIGLVAGVVLPLIVFNLVRSNALNALFSIPRQFSIEAHFAQMTKRPPASRSVAENASVDPRLP